MRPGCSRVSVEKGPVRAWCCAIVMCALVLPGCGAAARNRTDDLTTTTTVKIALLTDPRLGALRLEASTSQGVVTLSGAVTSSAEEQAAIAIARRVRGVRAVKSDLKVEGHAADREVGG